MVDKKLNRRRSRMMDWKCQNADWKPKSREDEHLCSCQMLLDNCRNRTRLPVESVRP